MNDIRPARAMDGVGRPTPNGVPVSPQQPALRPQPMPQQPQSVAQPTPQPVPAQRPMSQQPTAQPAPGAPQPISPMQQIKPKRSIWRGIVIAFLILLPIAAGVVAYLLFYKGTQ